MSRWKDWFAKNSKGRTKAWEQIIEERQEAASAQTELTQPAVDYSLPNETRNQRGRRLAQAEIREARNTQPIPDYIPPPGTEAAGRYEELQRLREEVLGHRF